MSSCGEPWLAFSKPTLGEGNAPFRSRPWEKGMRLFEADPWRRGCAFSMLTLAPIQGTEGRVSVVLTRAKEVANSKSANDSGGENSSVN